jgi:hypothetical protein
VHLTARDCPIATAHRGQIQSRVDKKLVKNFIRDAYGRWTCIEPTVFDLPAGRIEVAPGTRLVRGTKFMGVDLAELLDSLSGAPSGPAGS